MVEYVRAGLQRFKACLSKHLNLRALQPQQQPSRATNPAVGTPPFCLHEPVALCHSVFAPGRRTR